jgi:hypothetical protein
MLMNMAIIEECRDVIVFMLCASNMCLQKYGELKRGHHSHQRAVSLWHRSGDHTLHHKCNAVAMF